MTDYKLVAWVTSDTVDGQTVNGKPRRIWWENNEGVGMPIYTAPQPAEQPECGCCGQTVKCDDDCDAVVIGGNKPAPDVAGLVEALEQCITSMLDSGYRADAVVIRAARTALAAHRKGGSRP